MKAKFLIPVYALMIAFAIPVNAQKVTLTPSGQSTFKRIKQSDEYTFLVNDNYYFITSYMERAVMNYYLQSFDKDGGNLASTPLEVNMGVFNNTFGIDQVLALGNSIYAMVEHLDKAAGKNTLLMREIDKIGKISSTEVEVMSIPFEKIMNSGYNYSVVSEDRNTLAVLGEMPFVKETPGRFKIALYNTSLKKLTEGNITLPGEDTKNKSMSIMIANDGTAYIFKKGMTKKGEITLAVYQWSATTPDAVKEYIIELTPPSNILNYEAAINSANELIIAGLYYERKTVTVGDTKTMGVFYFSNKNKSDNLFKTFTLDTPVDNLTARKLLINGNTVFLTAEQYKEERISLPQPAPGSAASFEYNYNYTHKNEFVIAMDMEGNKKFQLEMNREFIIRDFDEPYYSAYYICNGNLTVLYNDEAKKYIKDDSGYLNQIPVLVQITNEGLMKPPVVFKDELRIDRYHTLYPTYSIQSGDNQITFLMQDSELSRWLNVRID